MRCLSKTFLILLTATVLILVPLEAKAIGPLQLVYWDGALEFEFDTVRDRLSLPDRQSSEFISTGYQEGVTLISKWYILDPRLFSFSLGGGLNLDQRSAGSEGAESKSAGSFTTYDFSGTVLGPKPYAVNFFSTSTQGRSSTELGGLTEVKGTRQGVGFNWRNRFMPLNFRYRRSSREDMTVFAGYVTFRGETANNFTVSGSKPFYSADLDVDYEFDHVADEFFPRASFSSHRARARYSFDFGKDFNKISNTSLGVNFRQGATDLLTAIASENLVILHTPTLRTNYSYSLSLRQREEESPVAAHVGSFSLSHSLFESLLTGLGANGSFTDLDGGRFASLGSNLSLNYRKRLFKGIRLLLGTGLSYTLVDQDLPEGVLSVTGEEHVLQGVSPVRLENPLVTISSIVVTDVAGTTIFVRDMDYQLATFEDFVEIKRIVTGTITDGQKVLVDYDYKVSPDVAFSTLSTNYDFGLSLPFPSLSVNYERRQSSQARISGQEGQVFLEDRESDTISADINLSGARYQLSLGNEYSKFESVRLSSESWRFDQSFLYRPFYNLSLSLSAAEGFDEFEERDRETSTYSQRLSILYQPLSFVFLDFFGSSLFRKDSVSPDETVFSFGVAPRISLPKLTINSSVRFTTREVASSKSEGFRVSVNVVRRF